MRIGVTNLKGGVGKTTVAINLSVCFAHSGYKVTIIDTDTNQNSVEWYEKRKSELKKVEVWSYTKPDKLIEQVKAADATNDIVILDGTPNLGVMTTKIMGASDILIIPIRPGANDYHSLKEFYARYEDVKAIREDLQAFFLLNEYQHRLVLHRTVKEALEVKYADIPILKTMIRSRVSYGECILNGTGVFEEQDQSAKAEMVSLAKEITAIGEKIGLLQTA